MRFIEHYLIDKIHAADYNPRKISDDSFQKLQESLKRFGVCKAVISNRDGTIIAGHQRTKAMKAVGIKECPVFIFDKNIPLHDEIRFNLFHNSVEEVFATVKIEGAAELPHGFSTVQPSAVTVEKKGKAAYDKEICRLLTKYGEYGSVVIDEAGTVVDNSDYAMCSKIIGKPVVVFKMHQADVADFLRYMGVDYGEYSYDTLGIKPYVQTYCQMNRDGKSISSTLYDRFVLPYVKKDMRIVDFGAGKMHYINGLRKQGFRAFGYEPYMRTEGKDVLNISAVIDHIKALETEVGKNGLFDVVILDSVLNSITSLEYEAAVLTVCNALCRPDGTFFTGTRNKEFVDYRKKRDKSTGNYRYLEFEDKKGFSATFGKGVWTMQKFNTPDHLKLMLMQYFDEVKVVDTKESQIYGICRKPKRLPIETYREALEMEFNIEYPDNYRHNQHKKLVENIIACLTAN